MKEEKQIMVDELAKEFSDTNFVILTDYEGLDVPGFMELRNKLNEVGSECHVHKNSLLKRAAKKAEFPNEITEFFVGQTALISGGEDVSSAAKAVVDIEKEIGKPKLRGGIVEGKFVTSDAMKSLASLPPLPVLQATLLGLLQAPASKLVRTLNEPASQLARVLKAKQEQG